MINNLFLFIGILLATPVAHSSPGFCTDRQEAILNALFKSDDVDVIAKQINAFEIKYKCTYNPLERILQQQEDLDAIELDLL